MNLKDMSDEEILFGYRKYSDLADKEYFHLGLDYNLKDTYLIQRFEDETALLSLVLTVAYGGGVNYSDAFGTVGIWESILYRKLMEENTVPGIKLSPGERLNDLVGGYVKDPVTGMSKWVVSFDLNSLYPMLFIQYNMSPETFISDERIYVNQDMVLEGKYKNEDKSRSVAANGVCFNNKNIGVIPSIIDEYYANRRKIKNSMLNTERDIELIKEEINRRK